MNKCHKTGKTKLNTKNKADRVKMYIWSHDPQASIFDLHTYLCPYCKMWHVGHKSYYEMSLKKRQSPYTSNDLNS